jgi:hypothetical protein
LKGSSPLNLKNLVSPFLPVLTIGDNGTMSFASSLSISTAITPDDFPRHNPRLAMGYFLTQLENSSSVGICSQYLDHSFIRGILLRAINGIMGSSGYNEILSLNIFLPFTMLFYECIVFKTLNQGENNGKQKKETINNLSKEIKLVETERVSKETRGEHESSC